jgi:enoyl-[acyl-carrier-protein] reductase (NADH)
MACSEIATAKPATAAWMEKTRREAAGARPTSSKSGLTRAKILVFIAVPPHGDLMGFLAGKRLLITGLLNNRSIAYGIAKACHREGAELAFSYVGERFKDRITEFAAEFGSNLIFDCDVAEDAQITGMFDKLGETWPEFDGFVHAIAFAPREAIGGEFLDGLSREGFRIAHDISAYSFPAMAKAALPRLRPGASLVTLSYLGAVQYVPNYKDRKSTRLNSSHNSESRMPSSA